MCSKQVRPPHRSGSDTSLWETSRRADADVIEQRAPDRVTASHCESSDKRNGTANANLERLDVLDEYNEHAPNARNITITDVFKEIVSAHYFNTAFLSGEVSEMVTLRG